ncbi:ROK family protein [Saccharibacillus sp. CPCC 101409]|uniref:ROK family protein n=1 Tax=Saccharibacillus sp. CPCC 101409 TaxID=3058041 RepID=UPI00267294A0|nr:ROK family protein [Saccharibacillus sp. CPCC 101409]MDO3408443.1 ROK family protein [Saccharibacillus sp. CPCC 101409]
MQKGLKIPQGGPENRRFVLGIDIGGTGIKTGFVDTDGEVTRFRTLPTEGARGREALLDKICGIADAAAAASAAEGFELLGIGIGTAGFVDSQGRIAYATEILPGWTGTDLRGAVAERTGLDTAVLNDVHAIALGELWRGAGAKRGLRSFVCAALGTGIGGCIVEDGRIYGGRGGYAGGFGHMTVAQGGPVCSCGQRGCWEMYASVSALKRLIRERAEAAAAAAWERDPRLLFEAARAGDRDALGIVDHYAQMIAIGLVNLAHTLNCGDFVLGGAITRQGDFLLGRVEREMVRRLMPVYRAGGIGLHAAELGERAGVIGAAYALLETPGAPQ